MSLTTSTNRRRSADGLPRRDLLAIGGLAALGLSLPDWLQARRREGPTPRSCILVWLDGGPSHLETWDPKPRAPAEVRGPFDPVTTSVPGVAIGELLPRMAARLKHVALVRSVTSPLGEHNFGTHYLMSGYKPTPVLEYPCVGSVLAHLRPPAGVLPPHVAVPDFRVGGGKFRGHGFLPATARPFAVGSDPGRPGFAVRDLVPFEGLTLARLSRRREILGRLDRLSEVLDQPLASVASVASVASDASLPPDLEQAFTLVTSREARSAFRLEDEPPAVRQRYGRKTVGQACLLARRLIERGVPFVTVNARGWDTHRDLVTRLKDGFAGAKTPVGLIPSLDLALSALLDDLDQRGRLDATLVVVMGEFGRTPKLNPAGGRDHWPRVFSVLLAGGGIAGGQVVGRSDATGESPLERPVTPSDLAATIYAALGVDPGGSLTTGDGRPVRLVDQGKVIRELLGT